jgi:hypothetical protein
MKFRRFLAGARRVGTAAAVPAALGLAATSAHAATSVSVRVEAGSKTLVTAPNVTPPPSGSITKGGTPKGACKANTAAGALDVVTHHNWDGSYSSGLGIEVNTILGTTYSFSHGAYWGFFVDNRFASKGVCDTALRPGEQLLFARVPAKGKPPLPLVIKAPAGATAGKPFTVRAFEFPGKGNATKPVAGVHFAGFTATTNAKGVATITTGKTGTLSLVGSGDDVIRSAAVTVDVTK